MKKITLFLFALIFAAGAVMAQNSDKKWGIGLGPGVDYNMESEATNPLANFYLSRYLSPSFDLMLDNRIVFNSEGLDLGNPLLNLRYKLSNGYLFKENSAIQPYLFGGVGYLWDNLESGANFDFGAGFKFPVGQNTSLFVACSYVKGIEGTRTVNGVSRNVTDDHIQVTSIVEFAIGKAKDSDDDGVPDRKDECPDTPPGVEVDEKGCPLDRDDDGVPDYKDECPDKPGSAANKGCPDTDGDGIIDKEDNCPDTPGLAKFNGCPDTDGDGVSDDRDQCPDTPKGCPVNAIGCPLDSDGDGVIDCEDKCPQVAGSKDNEGCPDWSEITIPTIYFDFGSDKLKSEAKAELDKLASDLNAAKEYKIVIGGHTCNIGSENYNMKLSEKRAQAVVMYLTTKGVNNAYVGSHNYGEDKPAVPNTSSKNRKQNRRAEFEVAKVRK